MRVTIKDIAVRSNLSHTTVSRVLNRRGDAFISEETRQRIFALAREMGYQPNTIARALATGRSNTIALALGAYRALRDHGCRIPEDVAIVGCDGIAEAKYLDAPLTTIEQPIAEMCEIGWQFLKKRMDDPSLPLQSALLQSQLVIRKSSQR